MYSVFYIICYNNGGYYIISCTYAYTRSCVCSSCVEMYVHMCVHTYVNSIYGYIVALYVLIRFDTFLIRYGLIRKCCATFFDTRDF